MNRNQILVFSAFTLGVVALSAPSLADTFGSGANSFDIEFVTVGNPGNPPDAGGDPAFAGSVPYAYRIGKFEISEQMIDKANALGALGITKDTRGPDKPATTVDWFEAAKFVNWLNASTGHPPAYKFDASGSFQLWEPTDLGYNASNRFRSTLAGYFLPSVHEWYKAAYYDPASGVYWDYPTGSNAPPTAVASGAAPGTAVYHQDLSAGPADIMQAGGLSPYGTMAQGGNVYEWEETELDLINDELMDYRGVRGGFWNSPDAGLRPEFLAGGFPSNSFNSTGLRIASVVPEPSAAFLGLTLLGIVALTQPRPGRKWRCHGVPHDS